MLRKCLYLPLLLLLFGIAKHYVYATQDCIGEFDLSGNTHSSLENGYCDKDGYWVPGFITEQFHGQTATPQHTIGNVVWYSPHLMEDMMQRHGRDINAYLDGIAMMSKSDVGSTIWLRRPSQDWEGPYIVVDSVQRQHMFSAVEYRGEVAEIGFRTALRWGMIKGIEESWNVIAYRLDGVEVYKSESPPSTDSVPISYQQWWRENVRFAGGYSYTQVWDINPEP